MNDTSEGLPIHQRIIDTKPFIVNLSGKNIDVIPWNVSDSDPKRIDSLVEILDPNKKIHNVISVFGGAGQMNEQIASKLKRVLPRALSMFITEARVGSAIIDGATDSGMIKLTGEGVKEARKKSDSEVKLIGFCPARKTEVYTPGAESIEPNHDVVIMVHDKDSDTFGLETSTMIAVGQRLGQRRLAIASNGGAITAKEIEQYLASGEKLILIRGTDRYTDAIIGLKENKINDPNFPSKQKEMAELFLQQIQNNPNPELQYHWQNACLIFDLDQLPDTPGLSEKQIDESISDKLAQLIWTVFHEPEEQE